MNCPKCQSTSNQVIKVKQEAHRTVRTRQCKECNTRFRTEERVYVRNPRPAFIPAPVMA
jgi:transcriptional regulator NrdR family protein